MGIVRTTVKIGQKPTKKQLKELEEAAKREINLDDIPEITEEQYAAMAELARKKRAESRKPVVSIRIDPVTLAKAKATGKGYTRFLSRLLDNAINDPELVKKSL